MIDPALPAASWFLWVAPILFAVVYALPIFLTPLGWARWFTWDTPPRDDLAVYFGRCAGADGRARGGHRIPRRVEVHRCASECEPRLRTRDAEMRRRRGFGGRDRHHDRCLCRACALRPGDFEKPFVRRTRGDDWRGLIGLRWSVARTRSVVGVTARGEHDEQDKTLHTTRSRVPARRTSRSGIWRHLNGT